MFRPIPQCFPVPNRLPALPVLALVATLVFGAGCAGSESLTSAGDGADPSASSALAETANSSGGAVVTWGTLATGFILTDEAAGLTTIIGVTFEDLKLLCAGGETLPEIATLFVERPTGAIKQLWKAEALPVLVWQVVSGDVCGVLSTTEPYSEGTARLRFTDNDVSDFPVGPGGNTSSLRANGTVTVGATAQELHYQAVNQVSFERGATSFEDVRVVRSYIRLF